MDRLKKVCLLLSNSAFMYGDLISRLSSVEHSKVPVFTMHPTSWQRCQVNKRACTQKCTASLVMPFSRYRDMYNFLQFHANFRKVNWGCASEGSPRLCGNPVQVSFHRILASPNTCDGADCNVASWLSSALMCLQVYTKSYLMSFAALRVIHRF